MAVKTGARVRMIEAALNLFHRHGVNGTSIDRVLEESSTGKSQFSHYFKTKDGLVHAVLQHLHEVIRSGQAPTGYTVKTWPEMEAWFGKYIDFQSSVNLERSCPVGTIGNDISNEQELLRQDVRMFLEWSRSQLARFFAERKIAGELAPAVDPDSLADFCIAIMQGGMLLTKIKRDPGMFKNAARHAIAYLRSLRKQGGKS
jgi:TetR/AcrR family transcriptional regulator, transcriptional repressor for nem operon